jgi:hypothetical protein
MADEIEEVIVEDAPTEEVIEPEKVEEPQGLSEEEQATTLAKDELIQLGKAKAEALAELSRLRKEKQALKQEKTVEELPKIDLEDPSAKAWDNRIRETVEPVQLELEKARTEVREYALQKFLQEKPALAKDPEKVKALMSVYDRLHTASERTTEGVLTDLDMAYGALTYKEQQIADQQVRIQQAKSDAQFSEAAISRGATGYQSTPPGKMPKLSDEERDIIRKQGWTPEEWWKARQEQLSR